MIWKNTLFNIYCIVYFPLIILSSSMFFFMTDDLHDINFKNQKNKYGEAGVLGGANC